MYDLILISKYYGKLLASNCYGGKRLAETARVWNTQMAPAATKSTRHVFVKHGCLRRQQSQNMAKISKSYILTPPDPQGHVMSAKCEEPLDELTVQVWFLYDHPNFNYWTFLVSGTELRTDRQTDGQTDGQTIWLLDAPPAQLSGRGHKNCYF